MGGSESGKAWHATGCFNSVHLGTQSGAPRVRSIFCSLAHKEQGNLARCAQYDGQPMSITSLKSKLVDVFMTNATYCWQGMLANLCGRASFSHASQCGLAQCGQRAW